MTIEEMKERWPQLPPFEASSMDIWALSTMCKPTHLGFDINQDTIDEIIEYFQAAKEAMNG